MPSGQWPGAAGCNATASSTLTSTLMFTLAGGCGYGGTFSFRVPGDYLAANPTGNVSVLLSIGVNSLRTVILYTSVTQVEVFLFASTRGCLCLFFVV